MASYVTPKKNAAFRFYVSLVSRSSRPQFQSNPTLATGDVKVSTDGGTLTNLGTLPVVTPSGGKLVQVDLSADEMNGDNIVVVFSDAAGSEWDDLTILIQTTTRQVDDLLPTASYTAPPSAATVASTVWSSTNYGGWVSSSIGYKFWEYTSTITLTTIAAAVWDYLTSSMVTAGSIGARLVAYVDAAISGIPASVAALLIAPGSYQVLSAVVGDTIEAKRGDRWSFSLTVGSLTGQTLVWFTVKKSKKDPDSRAIVQITSTGGLIRSNGSPATSGNGSLTINTESTGAITIVVNQAETDDYPDFTDGWWDVQMLDANGITTKAEGVFKITEDVTRAIS